MAMIKFLFLIMVFTSLALAGEIEEAFKAKNFRQVVEIYKKDPNFDYTPGQLVYISYALRKLEFFRQDITLSTRLIKTRYHNHHIRLVKQIKAHETVDSDEYPEPLKVLYWNIFLDYGKIIESYESNSKLIAKDRKRFQLFSKILSELEFREGKVDRFNDRIVAHLTELEQKIYKFTASWNFSYVSWQSLARVKGPDQGDLIITNKGLCAGGDVGLENHRWHYYVDGCALMGSGGVSATGTAFEYQQSNVPAYGAKFGPGVSFIVSSSKSRIGVRLPLIYSSQKLSQPDPSSGDRVQSLSPLSALGSLYSRWQFKEWYFQTEFGKYLGKEQTFWGLGIGKNF